MDQAITLLSQVYHSYQNVTTARGTFAIALPQNFIKILQKFPYSKILLLFWISVQNTMIFSLEGKKKPFKYDLDLPTFLTKYSQIFVILEVNWHRDPNAKVMGLILFRSAW